MQSAASAPRVQPELTHLYNAHSFAVRYPDGWQDKTIFTLVGPVENGIQHNVIIALEHDVSFETVRDFAEAQIGAMQTELKSCRILKKGAIALADGTPAFKAICSWYPTDELQLYQEHIYVLVHKTAYRLTATFTKKTRKTLGPVVQRLMLSFHPIAAAAGSPAQGSSQQKR